MLFLKGQNNEGKPEMNAKTQQTEAEMIDDLTTAGRTFIELGATREAFIQSHKQGFPHVPATVWAAVEKNLTAC